MKKFEIDKTDVIDIDNYIIKRDEIKKDISNIKKNRRVQVGPYSTFYFECYDTMIYQVQEMLYIERGGIEQMKDEIKAYNPLVPKGKELVATLMFEIDNEIRRKEFLSSIGGIENKTFLQVGNDIIYSRPEDDTERTNEDGKASSVHFVHFDFTDDQILKFKDINFKIMLGFDHKNYKHLSELSSETKEALFDDFNI
ncbi:MAG: DUF3501 family protein [Alphaproteobacteria bacterium]|tara:strand:- start:932 stop:1522 length:591 start_codon:yes stop_codon:yes gene_type:complete